MAIIMVRANNGDGRQWAILQTINTKSGIKWVMSTSVTRAVAVE